MFVNSRDLVNIVSKWHACLLQVKSKNSDGSEFKVQVLQYDFRTSLFDLLVSLVLKVNPDFMTRMMNFVKVCT